MCIFSYEYILQVRLYSYLSAILWPYVLSLIDASSISLYKNTIHLLFTWNVCVRQKITISQYYKNKLVADKLKKNIGKHSVGKVIYCYLYKTTTEEPYHATI